MIIIFYFVPVYMLSLNSKFYNFKFEVHEVKDIYHSSDLLLKCVSFIINEETIL